MIVRLGFCVLIILVFCALSLIKSQYQVRSLFIRLELAQFATHQLDIDFAQMQLDQSILNGNSRIEALARRNLNMVTLTQDCIQYFTIKRK